MKRSTILFPLLLLLMAGSFYYAWQNTPRTKFATKGEDRSGSSVSIEVDGKSSNRLNFSGGEQRKFRTPKKNLFGLLYPAPRQPKKKPVVTKPVVVAKPIPRPVAPPPPMPVRSNVPRMPAFKVIGFLEKEATVTAFVSLQGEIYLLRDQQQFADEFQVVEMTLDEIRIARIQGPGEVTLPLRDQSLKPGGAAQPVGRPQFPAGHPPIGGGS